MPLISSNYILGLNHCRVVRKIGKKCCHIFTYLNLILSPHDIIFVALKGQKSRFLLSKMFSSHIEQGEMSKKGRGVATVVYVKHGCRSFPSTYSNTHKNMATPLLLSVEIALCPRCEHVIWASIY